MNLKTKIKITHSKEGCRNMEYELTARLNQHANKKITSSQEVYDDLVKKLEEKNQDNSELLMLGFLHESGYIVSGVEIVEGSVNISMKFANFSYVSREDASKHHHVIFEKDSEYGSFIES